MTRTLIKDVEVVTLDDAGTVLPRSHVAIDGKTIIAVGEQPPGFVPDQVIDGYNHAALPGFYNAHAHVAMTFERGWAEDLPLDRWFNERIWVAESALTADDVYHGAALAACELLRSGCVAFNDHYFHMDRVAKVVDDSGMKALLGWCQFGIGADKEVGATLDGALSFARDFQDAAGGRVKTLLAPHSPYVCPPEFLREVSALARRHRLPLHIHASESPEQVENSLRTHGRTPVAHLEACGVLDVPCVVAHALYLTGDDVEVLARHGATVAHCPITYMKLGMGVGDLRPLQSAGVNVALGTDGPGSNSDLDMKTVVRFAPLLQKHHLRDAEALPGDLPLRMATGHGARAMGFPDAGVLAPGRAADIILVNLDQPHLYPRHNLVANLVHSARGGDVTDVIIDGRLVVRRGEVLTLDVDRIQHEADARARRMVTKNLHVVRTYNG
jgi:5-methylthioadenosine/S-adenosylhomocysteine deaminase